MRATRPRPFAAILAIFAVLFAQLAVSAYACPGSQAMLQAALAKDAPPCHESPASSEQAPLCQAHCQQGDQSLDLRGASVPVASLVALPASWLPVAVQAQAPEPPGAQASLLERPTGPPLAVRHCRFLI